MPVSTNGSKKIIRNVNDLPDWFSLKKYQGAINLTAGCWYDLLVQRWSHNYYFDHFGLEKYKNYPLLYSALLTLRETPLDLMTDGHLIYFMGGGKLAALKFDPNDFARSAHAISPLTVRQIYQNERRMDDKTRTRIRRFMDQIFEFNSDNQPSKKDLKWARSFIDDPIFEGLKKIGSDERTRSYDLVKVDLSVPDKILIEQFSDYLRQVRKTNPDIKPAKPYKAPEYKKWIEYGVLPYLDLKMWEKENNTSIPYRVMADAIFPAGSMGEEMIRKTTKKMADQVMEADFIDFLAVIAAQEIAEKI